MKKITLLFLLLTSFIFSNIRVMVSILPEQTFVKAIGKDKVSVSLMVKPGNSPHTYEPKPSQMIDIAKSTLYFAIDVEFEHVWLPKFKSLNPHITIIDIAENITKIGMHKNKKISNTKHSHEGKDPHIWTAPDNVRIIAQNIYNALSTYDKKNKEYYKKNLDTFLASINKLDKEIVKSLSTLNNKRKFMVFHPSWGYFAKQYQLTQIAVEVEGKSPKPKELISLIKKARETNVNAIFTQPEFSDSSAKIIANELKIPVIKVSPLSADWSNNLLNIAKAIAGKK